MSLYGLLAGKGPNGLGYSTTAEDVTRGLSLAGKNVLITGCTSGLGQEAARVLVRAGAHVIGTARTRANAEAALSVLGGKTTGVACELSDPKSVREAVSSVRALNIQLDAIIANAGIMALPKLERAHGYELQFFTNHIGHFILITELLERLGQDGRVVIVSSEAHRGAYPEGIQFDNLRGERGYNAWKAYGQSKFANILFTKELARRFAGTRRTANALHPGVIHTNLARHMNKFAAALLTLATPLALKSVSEGAATEVYLAVHPDAAKWNGEYFSHCNPKRPRKDAEDAALAKRLWEESERIVAQL